MSIDFIARIIGMILFAILGAYWGSLLGVSTDQTSTLYAVVLGFLGALVGLVLTPYISTRPVQSLKKILGKVSAGTLIAGLVGLTVGMVMAALVAFPLSLLPSPFGKVLPFIGALLFGYFGVAIFIMRQDDILKMIRGGFGRRSDDESIDDPEKENRPILIDTSVVIDGRIADISRTGFLIGTLLIPRFVLNELQYVADSSDGLRRQRGRRGMEVLASLQHDSNIPVKISDIDVEGVDEVDDKLVILARQLRCPILTNDYNLNRVAELQGVPVLNVNELANAVKAVMLPGETIHVNIIQEGKEPGQGVAYLDDGTMVVVENGREFLHSDVQVTVTKVLQTAAGRMIFARLEENQNDHSNL
ncbi:MAG: TRAM domain-containing protein [Anaerolineales bacterium]|nr:TRAM domain-containing protein [Anaerolineales bacterium]